MPHAPTRAALLPNLLPESILQAASPSPLVPPSVANLPAGLAHDARNMLAAMDIYCELLSGPGVLSPQYLHLVDELRLLRESSSGLMDRLILQAARPSLESSSQLSSQLSSQPSLQPSQLSWSQPAGGRPGPESATEADAPPQHTGEPAARKPVESVARVLLESHRMLAALAGPKVQLEINVVEAPEGLLRIAAVDFTRVFINLVRNAAEAMGTGGRIQIAALRAPEDPAMGPAILVSVEDNGPGIPLSLLERIFDLNIVDETGGEHTRRRMSFRPRGLGLRIVRELVQSGGGAIKATRLPERGSRFEIVLPIVTN